MFDLKFYIIILIKMHVLDVNEIFGMTFYTYDRILEEWGKNWPDAIALYIKLLKQTRIQQTNQTKSLNIFLKEWLGWWDERLKKARQVLKSLGLIDDVVIRDELWKLAWHYVRVNFLINEQKVRTLGTTYNLSTTGLNPCVDTSTSGQTDTNALSNININAWSIINKNSISKQDIQNQNLIFYTIQEDTIIKHENEDPKDWSGELTYSEKDLEKYWKDMLIEFNRYYSEPNTKWKQKRQLQKTWSLGWRLATWKKNNEKRYGKKYEPVDYENNLQLFLTRLKTDYEWLKKEVGNDKFFELKQKALEYWAVNKLL